MRYFVLTLAVLLTFCTTPARVGVHQSGTDIAMMNIAFENGDPAAGRVAFIDSGCAACHRVAHDTALPAGGHVATGSLLRDLSSSTAVDVAQRIAARPTEPHAEGSQAMKDRSQQISTRELADIVAYLRTPSLQPGT